MRREPVDQDPGGIDARPVSDDLPAMGTMRPIPSGIDAVGRDDLPGVVQPNILRGQRWRSSQLARRRRVGFAWSSNRVSRSSRYTAAPCWSTRPVPGGLR